MWRASGVLTIAVAGLVSGGCGGTVPQFVGEGGSGPDGSGGGGNGGDGSGGSGGEGGTGGMGPMTCSGPNDCDAGTVCEDGICVADGDDDGFSDALEADCGTDPNSGASVPNTATFGGSGTTIDPFRICLADQLYAIGDELSFMSATFLVTRDLDISRAVVDPLPIGSETAPFMGTFDGGARTLSNTQIALFDVVGSAGVVKALRVMDGSALTGGIAHTHRGTMSDVHFAGAVTGSSFTGGLIGTNDGSVTGCSTTGTVGDGNHIGGLVGSNNGNVALSWSTATVTANNRVGGLVGSNNGTVERSYAASTVSGQLFVGGLIGSMFAGSLHQSYVHCGLVTSVDFPAGLVGSVSGAVIMSDSYAVCPVAGNNAQGLIGTGGAMINFVDACYFDTSMIPVGDFGTGITNSEMRDPTTFVGFNFVDTWKFDTAISPYPVFSWQTQR